jgi:hypothetical protein
VRQLAKSFPSFSWICQELVWKAMPDTTCCALGNHRKAGSQAEGISRYAQSLPSGIYRNKS